MKKELENLIESDEKVRQMLASLKQVEAPKDFEFRLKARIANASPKAYQIGGGGSFKRRLAFALPAFASIAVSSFVVLNGNFFGGGNQVSSIPDTQAKPVNVSQPQNSPNEFVAANTTVNSIEPKNVLVAVESNNRTGKSLNTEASFTVVRQAQKPKTQTRRESGTDNEIFSKDSAVTLTPVLTPPGISSSPDKKVEPPKDFNSNSSSGNGQNLSAQDMFLTLGMETVSENGSLKVKSVKQNSPAERVGIKNGDVIETLNGQKVSAEPLRGKKIELKKIGVRRAGAQFEIPLR